MFKTPLNKATVLVVFALLFSLAVIIEGVDGQSHNTSKLANYVLQPKTPYPTHSRVLWWRCWTNTP